MRRAVALALAALLAVAPAAAAEPPSVAAASDLQFALPEIAADFARGGAPVKLVFGSSGNLRRQIEQGAPFELFLSADESYVLELERQGRTEGAGVLYAVGRIVLFLPKGSKLKPDASLRDLAAALDDGRLRRLAIANPEHAPYGRAAREALTAAGLWPKIVPRLVYGENVSQAAQFATTGSAQAGIIAYSLAVSPRLQDAGIHVLLPADGHQPLRQRMALMKNAGPTTRAFYAHLQGASARAVFRRYGFVLPGEPN